VGFKIFSELKQLEPKINGIIFSVIQSYIHFAGKQLIFTTFDLKTVPQALNVIHSPDKTLKQDSCVHKQASALLFQKTSPTF